MYNKNRKEQVKELWEKGLTSGEIAKSLGINVANVSTHLTKLYGKDRKRSTYTYSRKYDLNIHYFDQIDTSNKAYFLGLFASDGYIGKDNTTCSIALINSDREILEKFNIDLNYNRPLILQKKAVEPGWNRKDQCKITFYSKEFTGGLIKHGITNKKHITMKVSELIPDEFIGDFIRGFFDGDGCFSFNGIGGEFSFACNLEFSESLMSCFKRLGISSQYHLGSGGGCYYLRSCKLQSLTRLYNFMYQKECIHLSRKKEKFEKWMQNRRDKNLRLE